MTRKTENVIIGLVVGGLLGGLAGAIISTQPPLRLHPEEPSPLDESNLGFGTLEGAFAGSILGGALGLASD